MKFTKVLAAIAVGAALAAPAAAQMTTVTPLNRFNPGQGYMLMTPGQPTQTLRPFNQLNPNAGYQLSTPGQLPTTITPLNQFDPNAGYRIYTPPVNRGWQP